ncbi:hypothetical protein L6452_41875 [Arctium lappa]|uniref:Uncharacterized protein n=1 Tax=Arctium lappa TaxID=4217 RepID=A0ACB8XGY1_ARCLA|nr:hypothetical protein L6452_41875 [Arctium lappa]
MPPSLLLQLFRRRLLHSSYNFSGDASFTPPPTFSAGDRKLKLIKRLIWTKHPINFVTMGTIFCTKNIPITKRN